jgi:hypothetical protein
MIVVRFRFAIFGRIYFVPESDTAPNSLSMELEMNSSRDDDNNNSWEIAEEIVAHVLAGVLDQPQCLQRLPPSPPMIPASTRKRVDVPQLLLPPQAPKLPKFDTTQMPQCGICHKVVVIPFRASCGDHHCHLKCLIRMYSNAIKIHAKVALEGTTLSGKMSDVQISIERPKTRCPICRLGSSTFKFNPGASTWLQMFGIVPPSHDELRMLEAQGLLVQVNRAKLQRGHSVFRCPMCHVTTRDFASFLRHVKNCSEGFMWCSLCQARVISCAPHTCARMSLKSIERHVRNECTGVKCPDPQCSTRGTVAEVIKCYGTHTLVPRIDHRIKKIQRMIRAGLFKENKNPVPLTIFARYVDEVFNYLATCSNNSTHDFSERWLSDLFVLNDGNVSELQEPLPAEEIDEDEDVIIPMVV